MNANPSSFKLHPSSLLSAHLDTWTSAIKSKSSAGRGGGKKQEFHGIKKLRELILELAVRGLLVPQDPEDEPAAELLKKISQEKAQLVKAGKIKKQSPQPPIQELDKPFQLPVAWSFVRFGDVFSLEYGNNLPAQQRSETGEYPVYGSNGIVGSHKESCVTQPCIVVGRKGSAGALNLCRGNGCWVTDVAYSVVPPSALLLEFVYLHFHTLRLDDLGKGIKPGLSRNEAYKLIVPLPPLAEQHRIVAKVDELMALCDRLEQRQEDNTRTHAALVETLLSALTAAKDHEAFTGAWQQIAAQFHTLFTTESSIDHLKQTILQLAVMGKLVKQEPGRSIAIWVTMEELVGRKNLKNGLSLTPVSGPSDFVCLPLSAMNEATIDCSFGKPISIEPDRAEPYLIKEGDIFIIRGNGSKERVGVAGMARSCPPNVLFPDLFIRVPLPPDKIDGDYFLIAWNSATTRKRLETLATTTSGIWKVNQGHISECEIPLPPLAEQHRIVAKVDELMALCDRLKARLQSAQATQIHLSDTLVEVAIQSSKTNSTAK